MRFWFLPHTQPGLSRLKPILLAAILSFSFAFPYIATQQDCLSETSLIGCHMFARTNICYFCTCLTLHFVFLLSAPPKVSLLIQRLFISCLLEPPNCDRPWGFKRKHDRYSQRGLGSLQCLNSLTDSLIIQNLFSLWCAMLSSPHLAVTETDTLTEALGSWSLGVNANIEQIPPSVRSVVRKIITTLTTTDSYGILIIWQRLFLTSYMPYGS